MSSHKDKLIYIEKLAAVPGGRPCRSTEEHIMGDYQGDGLSIPVEYNIEGYLLEDIKLSSKVIISRTKRNGEDADGFFISSLVTEIGSNYFKTENSVYSYKFL